ncbi:hypothetical protein [Planobispora longispora]|uniref:hypothetical protein n=1 Tax=Planobispora longispora TaxID=28887 RepID=UPI00361210A2
MTGLVWHACVLAVAGVAAFLLLRRIPAGAPRRPAAGPGTPEPSGQEFTELRELRELREHHEIRELRWWERRLAFAYDDPAKYPSLVRDRLADLAAERLRLRHGATGPQRARDILGDDLHALITAPRAEIPTRAELARLVARIEEI